MQLDVLAALQPIALSKAGNFGPQQYLISDLAIEKKNSLSSHLDPIFARFAGRGRLHNPPSGYPKLD